MGLIKAFTGALGGDLADQWKDFFTIPNGITSTAAVFPAVPNSQNAGRGSNTKVSQAVISNGSKILVPEGYGLVTFQDAEITSFISDPGGYIWNSDDINSQSIFAGDGILDSVVLQSWDRFKFGGRPSGQQTAIFICLKELPNNRFGTQSEIYWDDKYLNAQVGAVARGTYVLKIIDPIIFIKNFLPAAYLQSLNVFDFTDSTNSAASQIFSEVVASLSPAFSAYVNSSDKENRISQIQQDSIGFGHSLSQIVEQNFNWKASKGLEIQEVAIMAIQYDDSSQELLKAVQRADALSGTRGNSNLQASVAAGIQAAGENGGPSGVLGLGIAGSALGIANIQQSGTQSDAIIEASKGLMIEQLTQLKIAFDNNLITQTEYDAARTKILNI